jgi:hypothetical protein
VLAPTPPSGRYRSAVAHIVAYTIAARPWFDIQVRREPDYWTVVDRETGIFGHGDDLLAALRDFDRAAVEHLDVLQRQESLTDELTAQVAYLRQRVA